MTKCSIRYAFITTWMAWALLFCVFTGPALAETNAEAPENSEDARPAVQPELEAGTDAPPDTKLPVAINADIKEQLQTLETSLDQRLAAVRESRERLTYAESILTRLQDEYESFELRLEKAGLNLTASYADLLKQRLERLQRQSIASDLIEGIEDKLSKAREEQLRLEEFEAITGQGNNARGQLSQLLRGLHKAVTEHIGVLNEYYSTVTSLQDQVLEYQKLLQQRLFWLPSASVVNTETAGELYESAKWFISQLRFDALIEAVEHSVAERGGRIGLVMVILLALLIKRKAIKRHLLTNNRHIGNVGHDRTAFYPNGTDQQRSTGAARSSWFFSGRPTADGRQFFLCRSFEWLYGGSLYHVFARSHPKCCTQTRAGRKPLPLECKFLAGYPPGIAPTDGLCNSCGCYYYVNKLNAGRGAI